MAFGSSHSGFSSRTVIVVLTDGSVRLYHEPTIRVADVLRDFPHHTLATGGVNAQSLAADRLLRPGGTYLLDVAAREEWEETEQSDAAAPPPPWTGEDPPHSFDDRVFARAGCFVTKRPAFPSSTSTSSTTSRPRGDHEAPCPPHHQQQSSRGSGAALLGGVAKPLTRATSTPATSLLLQEFRDGGATSRGSTATSSSATTTPVPPPAGARPTASAGESQGETIISPRRGGWEAPPIVSPPIDSSISPRGLFVSSTRKLSRALSALPLPKYSAGGGAAAKDGGVGGRGGGGAAASASSWSLMGLVSPRGPRRQADENSAAKAFSREYSEPDLRGIGGKKGRRRIAVRGSGPLPLLSPVPAPNTSSVTAATSVPTSDEPRVPLSNADVSSLLTLPLDDAMAACYVMMGTEAAAPSTAPAEAVPAAVGQFDANQGSRWPMLGGDTGRMSTWHNVSGGMRKSSSVVTLDVSSGEGEDGTTNAQRSSRLLRSASTTEQHQLQIQLHQQHQHQRQQLQQQDQQHQQQQQQQQIQEHRLSQFKALRLQVNRPTAAAAIGATGTAAAGTAVASADANGAGIAAAGAATNMNRWETADVSVARNGLVTPSRAATLYTSDAYVQVTRSGLVTPRPGPAAAAAVAGAINRTNQAGGSSWVLDWTSPKTPMADSAAAAATPRVDFPHPLPQMISMT